MVEIARTLGQYSRQLRDLSREFTGALQAEIQATEEEVGKAGQGLQGVQRDLEDVLTGAPSRDNEEGTATSRGAEPSAEGEGTTAPQSVDEVGEREDA